MSAPVTRYSPSSSLSSLPGLGPSPESSELRGMPRPPDGEREALHVHIAVDEGEDLIGPAENSPTHNQPAAQHQPVPASTVSKSICTRLKNNLDGCGAFAGAAAVGTGVGAAVGVVTSDPLLGAFVGCGTATATLLVAACVQCCCRPGDA